mmetsp:Transcript_12911/g.19346  ORF Transcript_12911/g.19346 Transcript_12911/m.19346 type:complete len:397 (-) Transcript_12911:165-1355(-)
MWGSRSPMGRDGSVNREAAVANFRKYFGYGSSEKVLHVCTCALRMSASGFFGGSKDTVWEGLLYGSTNNLSFVVPSRSKNQRKIPLETVTAIRPGFDTQSLQVETSETKFQFIKFRNRDDSMGRFMEMWTNSQQRNSERSSILDDPLAVGVTVGIAGQKVKVTGKDMAAAAAVAKRHAHKVDVQVKDGNVAFKFNPNKKRGGSSPSERPKRYLKMSGHKGVQAARMGLYIEEPERGSDGYSAFRHIEGGWYMYYYQANKFWFVGSKIGRRSGWLYVQSDHKHPDEVNRSWRFWDDAEKKWIVDKDITCVHITQAQSKRDLAESLVTREHRAPSSLSVDSEKRNSKKDTSSQEVKYASDSGDLFIGTSLEGTWFSALYELYLVCDPRDRNVETKTVH